MAEIILSPIPVGATVTPKPAKAPRADYDQKLANDITETGTLLANAFKESAVLAALTYSEAELQEGLARQVAAQAAFGLRQKAQGLVGARRDEREALLTKLMDEFKAFRITVKNSFPVSAHTALGASGRLPEDLQKLITLVRSSYETAKSSAYLPTLEKRKITGPLLTARLAEAERLESLDGQFKAADKGAAAATRARDEAGEAMRSWISKFRRQAKSDLRRHPDLLAKLGM